MFVLCPQCQFLVALDPGSNRPPRYCPRCMGRMPQDAVVTAPTTPSVAAFAPSPSATPDPAVAAPPSKVEIATPISRPDDTSIAPAQRPEPTTLPAAPAPVVSAPESEIADLASTRNDEVQSDWRSKDQSIPAAEAAAPGVGAATELETASQASADDALDAIRDTSQPVATEPEAVTEASAQYGAEAASKKHDDTVSPRVADAPSTDVSSAAAPAESLDVASTVDTAASDAAQAAEADAHAPTESVILDPALADIEAALGDTQDESAAQAESEEIAAAASRKKLPSVPPPGQPQHGARTAPSFARHPRSVIGPAPRRLKYMTVAVIGLALMLLLQLLVAERAQLAQDARWRPALTALCWMLRCNLPAWREPSAFTLLQRDVRPHPTIPGALKVTATLRNDARWPQPWPALLLTLSDVDGRTVGARAFLPSEYLGMIPASDRSTQKMLASGQSVSVRLDIAEPSPRIVAFTFDFR